MRLSLIRESGVTPGFGSPGVGVVRTSWRDGLTTTGPNDDDGEKLLFREWSKGFNATDCLLLLRTGECDGLESEIERCDAVSFSLSDESGERDESSSPSESGRAVGGGIMK